MQAFSENVATFSGTASKWAQRAANAYAAQTGHELFSMDISAAFLKGMTFAEIAKLTGYPLRSVQFDFPNKDAWLLQQLPGMDDFDNHVEVVDLIKALWGLNDAPRAFGLRLKQTLRSINYVQGVMDPQIWRKFKQNSEASRIDPLRFSPQSKRDDQPSGLVAEDGRCVRTAAQQSWWTAAQKS